MCMQEGGLCQNTREAALGWSGKGAGLRVITNATFILAWVLGPFLLSKRDKRMGQQVNLKGNP